MKRSKSGEKETDISTLIKWVKAEVIAGNLRVTALTSADSEKYLNPEYVAKAIEERFAVSGENGNHVITRTKQYLADGETEFM